MGTGTRAWPSGGVAAGYWGGPVSWTQLGLLFDSEHVGAGALYRVAWAARWRGAVDTEALAGALDGLVRRHDALRIALREEDGGWRQRVDDPRPFALTQIETTEEGIDEELRALAGRRFDLAHPPLARAALMRIAPHDHVFALVLHHAVCDRWALRVLLGDVERGYAALAAGRRPPAGPPAPSFAREASASRARAAAGELERNHDHWRRALAGAPPSLELALGTPRARRDFETGVLRRRLSRDRLSALGAVAAQSGATPHAAFLAAYAVTLRLLGGGGDVVIGLPLAGRSRPHLEDAVGLFVSTVPARLRIEQAATLRAVLESARDQVVAAQEHQEVAFPRLVGELGGRRAPGRHPVFQFLLDWSEGEPRCEPPGLRAEALAYPSQPSPFDLSVVATVEDEGLVIAVEHATAVYDRRAAATVADALERVLVRLVDAPETTVAEVVPQAVPVPARPAARRDPAIGRLLAQARERPDAAALREEGREIGYGALAALVEERAAALRHAGVEPGQPVALALERGVDHVVSMLAAIRIGAAFAPLDPADPPARRRAQLAAIRPAALLTGGERLVTEPAGRPRRLGGIAYVMATSGSSGRPHCVPVGVDAFENHVAAARGYLGLGERDRVLQFAPTAFDTVLEEVLPALTAGACVVTRPPDLAWSVDRFAGFCEAEGITVADLPTAFWERLVASLDERGAALPSPLRLVVIGGEAARPRSVAAWLRVAARGSRVELLNTYGPTEAAVVATSAALAEGCVRDGLVTIGSPLPGVGAYVLDERMQPVMPGVTGELYLGGVCVARGYLDEPGLSAARFVPDPFAGQPGARMYRTGDRVRAARDGTLWFVGRADGQLKVRGHRVEPAEVERALLEHPAVEDAALVPPPRDAPDAGLVAAVAARGPLSDAELHEHLAGRLPGYMRPVRYARMPALPRTSRGKLDRAVIAARSVAAPSQASETPRTDRERMLLETWSELFEDRPVGVTDDFFELGGHSLLGLRLIEALRTRWGLRLDVVDLLDGRTIRAIAPRLVEVEVEAGAGERRPGAPLRDRRAPADSAPLTPTQTGIWLEDQLAGKESPYRIVVALSGSGRLDAERLEGAVRAVAERAPVLRSTVEEELGALVQRAGPAESIALERLALEPGVLADRERAGALVAAAATAPGGGLPFAARLCSETPERHLLLLSLHHIAADAATARLVVEELTAAYAGGLSQPAPSFFDFARSGLPPADSQRWRAAFEGASFELGLPLDRPPPAQRGVDAHSARASLPGAASERLRAVAEHCNGTPFMVGLALAAAWLHRVARQDDVVIGTAVSRRVGAGLERVVGPLVEVVPVRSRAVGGDTLHSLLAGVRELVAAALEAGSIPLRELVAQVGATGAAASRSGLFRVLFDAPDAAAELPAVQLGECRLEPFDHPVPTSRADLELSLRTNAGGRLAVELRGRADVLDRGTVDSLARSFAHFAAGCLEAPGARLSSMSLAAPGAGSLVRGPRAAGVEDVLERFDRVCDRGPDRTALVLEGRSLSYGDLRARCRAVGAAVQALGERPRVGLLLRRGTELPAALLGSWRAGGTCVLLDPAQPAARLRSMLARARLDATLVAGDTLELAAEIGAARPIDVATAPDVAGGRGARGPGTGSPYMAFTSGSTGEPKAVACAGPGLANLLAWSRRAIPLGDGESLLHVAAPGFDIALWELLHPLLCGGRVVVLPPERHGDPRAIIDAIDAEGIDAVHLVPSVLRAVLDELRDGEAASLRAVVCGGELMSPRLRRRLLERLDVEVHHTYGPTEASILATHWGANQEPPHPLRLPLGHPTLGAVVQVVDPAGALVPQGAAGELCLAGEPVGWGYPDASADTAARFEPDPHGTPGGRRYRTGDAGRVRSDGTLEFLGRLDRQVKVAGVRVEPAEVEAQLAAHPDVGECAVAARSLDERVRLVAWVVPARGRSDIAAPLRSYLRERLPAALVPAAFVELDRLPRLANGKLDPSRLPPPPAPGEREGATPAAPRDDVERRLLAAWRAVLGAGSSGIDDDFFDLGGDSITAIRLVARARAEGLAIELGDVLRNPTVARLAPLAKAAGPVAAIVGPDAPIPITPSQARLLAARGGLPCHDNLTIVLESSGRLTAQSVERALLALVDRHEALRQRFSAGSPATTTASPHAPPERLVHVESARVIDPAGVEDAVRSSGQAAQRALDPRTGPTIGAALVEAPHRTIVVLTAHHLAVDLVALQILVEDLGRALDQLDRGEQPDLPEPPCSFAAWARHAGGRPAGAAPAPTTRPRPLPRDLDGPNIEGGRRSIRRSLGTAATARLERACERLGAKPVEILAAELAGVTADWAGARAIPIAIEEHGRDAAALDLSRTVGWIAAERVVRFDPSGAPEPAVGAEIGLNYLGSHGLPQGALGLEPVDLDPGPTRDPELPRPLVFDVEAWIGAGALWVEWGYGSELHERATVEALLDALEHRLGGLAALHGRGEMRVEAEAPLTPLQEGMLARTLSEPGRGIYHTQVAFQLDGPVDTQTLREAWLRLARSADAFRTEFSWRDSPAPRQRVLHEVELDWREHRAETDAGDALEELLRRDLAEPFELDRAPLWRLHLLETPGERRLVWSHHHILFDGWSLPLVTQELGRAYADVARGTTAPARALPSHLDLARWWHTRERGADRAFWSSELSGLDRAPLLTPHRAALSGSANGGSGGTGGSATLGLGPGTALRLGKLARARGVTLHALTLAAWAIVVQRLLRRPDVVVGVVTAIRPPELPQAESTIGLAMNAIPLRLRFDGSARLGTVVDQVQERLLSAYPHAPAPLAEIQAAAGFGGARGPLFDNLVAFENYPGDRRGEPLGDGRLRVLGSRERNEYPLVLAAVPDDELWFELMYTAPWRHGEAQRLLEQLGQVLAALLEGSAQPVT